MTEQEFLSDPQSVLDSVQGSTVITITLNSGASVKLKTWSQYDAGQPDPDSFRTESKNYFLNHAQAELEASASTKVLIAKDGATNYVLMAG